ncbi:pre-peptidase C-terminal domain-containing protein [Streptomyces erythrochromogenes]|uniref:pre-peptidase C-terminal domain-containing protein n=1 Tax=Streptomyces erythrochromogenes TaxID=285574 RepID=UPI0038208CAE
MRRTVRRAVLAAAMTAVLALPTVIGTEPAHAAASRIRLGNAADASRASWEGPAHTMNGAGAVVAGSMARAIDDIRGGSGSLDVVVLAGSAPSSGSKTPECDTAMTLPGVNSCTTWTLTASSDTSNTQLNTDIRKAEFVYFSGGDQCRYASWKGTALEASVESVVTRGGGSGGGSAGHHINSPIVYDACNGSVTSSEALADPYDRYVSFTGGMFAWSHYDNVINDSHFVARDRMGRLMAFVARSIKDGLTTAGSAWGVGVEEGGSLHIDKNGLATAYGKTSYVVLGDHQPEQAAAREPLTYSSFKIWKLTPGASFDFADRPTCGYYLRSVTAGVPDANLYDGSPQASCTPQAPFTEAEPNNTRDAADDATNLAYPATLTGRVDSTGDRDYFAVRLTAGQRADVRCDVPSDYDADVYLLDGGGSTLTRSVNDGAGAHEALDFAATATGTHFLEVAAYSGSGVAGYTCTLAATQL